jgi:tellurite resistance protein
VKAHKRRTADNATAAAAAAAAADDDVVGDERCVMVMSPRLEKKMGNFLSLYTAGLISFT